MESEKVRIRSSLSVVKPLGKKGTNESSESGESGVQRVTSQGGRDLSSALPNATGMDLSFKSSVSEVSSLGRLCTKDFERNLTLSMSREVREEGRAK